MDNLFVRITILLLASFGLYKMFPQISGPVDYYIKNPQFQQSYVQPTINSLNHVLPDRIQIPTPEVKGVSSDYAGDSPLKAITDEISRQTASLAANQIEQIKQAASDQFCSILIEKIKSECGQ